MALCALALLGPALLGAPALAEAQPAPAPSGVWDFSVSLDGKPIGRHRFTVTAQGDTRQVHSVAEFAVKFLGITVYRYHHEAREEWRGDCLTALTSTTDDHGTHSSVRTEYAGDTLTVYAGGPPLVLPGCVMSYAYWNPAMRTQTRLLNAQTGRYDAVRIGAAGSGSIDVHGQPVPATRWRITGPPHPIDVWYSARDAWVGLDSTVAGGRTLSYRLP
ncbi:MAG: hypothetical protein KGL99_04945 [Burkholderiales bacterium]|nr:hypothetical protein [Burkholderiales bacterium]MDE2626482.1 hypothetical protein [Burkholderiales bacterium]